MAISERRALNQVLRYDLTAFIMRTFQTVCPGTPYLHNWQVEAISYRLVECQAGRINRLIITQPPRSLKSICTSVAYVAWRLGHDPSLRFICVSYSNELALELARQFRLVVQSEWYRRLFPGLRVRRDTELEFVTEQGGGRLATSIGGTLTGRGADVIIIDDPLKAEEAQSAAARQKVLVWFRDTLVTRLNDKRHGTIIVVMQRLHEEDLAGHLLEQGGWDHLDLPAIAVEDQRIPIGPRSFYTRREGDVLHPAREPLEALEQIKAAMGSMAFCAQYQQRPVPPEGNLVRRKWFQQYDSLPELRPGVRVIQSWDVATTVGEQRDYSVCTTWLVEQNDYYLVHVLRDRLEYPELKRRIVAMAERHSAEVMLIEDAGPGTHLLQELRWDTPAGVPRPIGIKPDGDKVTRMAAQSASIEAGQVWLPKDAPWLGAFLHELLAFPNAKHDDQVDSVSQFLSWISRDRDLDVGGTPELITVPPMAPHLA
jgi:predicted phage terminase large subunit-like protein